MSSDMMIICKEDGSGDHDGNGNLAFFVDECSMGDPWSKFGKWFQERYCKGPSMLQQLAGINEHHYMELTEIDVTGIMTALTKMKSHKNLDIPKLKVYLKEHIGKHISTENW